MLPPGPFTTTPKKGRHSLVVCIRVVSILVWSPTASTSEWYFSCMVRSPVPFRSPSTLPASRHSTSLLGVHVSSFDVYMSPLWGTSCRHPFSIHVQGGFCASHPDLFPQ